MRVSTVPVAKPSAEQWKGWAASAGIHPVIIAWADRYQHAFASYTDGDQDSNELIFNPRHQREAYVTPRTLEITSDIVHTKEHYDNHALSVGIAGIVGKSAAQSIGAFIRHQDSLPPWGEIIKNPKGAKVPEDPGALAVLVFSSIERVQDSNELDSLLTYLKKAEEEWQSIFCVGLARHKEKADIAFSNRTFANWVQENEDIL
jgi:hypothetical protein